MALQKKLNNYHLTGLFVFVLGFTMLWQDKLTAYKINWVVVEGANAVLFVFTFLNIYFQQKNINNPNQSAVIRGVMAGTFLKLMGLAAAALIYLVVAGESRSVNAVFVGMGLYIIYTWLEVKISLQLKPKK
jgi:hypothetical protein